MSENSPSYKKDNLNNNSNSYSKNGIIMDPETKIKYKMEDKYRNYLNYQHAKEDYENKKLKRKLRYGKLYDLKNERELLKVSIEHIKDDEVFKYFEKVKELLKSGKEEEPLHMDFYIYTNNQFDASKFSYQSLVGFKTYLQHRLEVCNNITK